MDVALHVDAAFKLPMVALDALHRRWFTLRAIDASDGQHQTTIIEQARGLEQLEATCRAMPFALDVADNRAQQPHPNKPTSLIN